MFEPLDLTPKNLGFNKTADKTRIVVAMSGGVDSSVTASLLKEAGYDVVGVTLQLYDQGELAKRKGACCAGQDIYDAKCVAEKLGFPHYVLDYESIFKQSVIEDFADSYLRGETPVPCIRCNQKVKFLDLLKTAKDLQADALATGHYVQQQILPNGHAALLQGADPKKDQSYFMFATTQEQLDFLRFPLGSLHKDATRTMAKRLGLPVADKPDSQDICFVPDGNYANIVQKLRPESLQPGTIVTRSGQVVGHHPGVIGFTIGQRKGLKVDAQNPNSRPWYVIGLDPEKRQVIVGNREDLAQSVFSIKDLNWLGTDIANPQTDATTTISCTVKIRSTTPPLPAHATLNFADKTATITLQKAEYGVAPGQACVLYQETRVLGGGWISRDSALSA